MDWPSDRFCFTKKDFSLFRHEERESVVLCRSTEDSDCGSIPLTSQAEWTEWLKTHCQKNDRKPGICVVMCRRAGNLSGGEPSPISYLPFSYSTFRGIISMFRIHRSIARVVTRSVASFSSIISREVENGEPTLAISYRTTSFWADDMAMALTYSPITRRTHAIIFGCNEDHEAQISTRLRTVESEALAHPILLPGILAELERKRLNDLLEKTLDRFTLRAGGTAPFGEESQSTELISDKQMNEYLELCFESQNIGKEFKCINRQLTRMTQACDELQSSGMAPWRKFPKALPAKERTAFIKFGWKIKKRILEMIDEYENKVDECSMVLDNTSITMQTIWNHIAQRDAKVNTSIALGSKQDNAQMKSIALLTMIYLPVSAVASIFSMSIFDWSPKSGRVVSKYIWVFFVVSIMLTIITVAVWYFSTSTRKKRKEKAKKISPEDIETGFSNNEKSFGSEMSTSFGRANLKMRG